MNRTRVMALLVAGGLLAACDTAGTGGLTAPPAPRHDGHVQDLDGTPNLVVDAARLASSWIVTHEFLAPNLCSVQEGDVPPGEHDLLRFTVSTPNIGDADVFIGDPLAHADPNGDGNFSDSDGLFELATCHAHFHFRNYATYELLPIRADGSLGPSVKSRKRGFCMIDLGNAPGGTGVARTSWTYRSCGTTTLHGFQGISVGWTDTYVKALAGQYFVLDDPNEDVPRGDYLLRIHVNPGFPRVMGQPCPVFDPVGNLCHNFPESNYNDNVGSVRITIPDHKGKTGGTVKTADDGIDAENRPAND